MKEILKRISENMIEPLVDVRPPTLKKEYAQ